ncbi:MAG: Gldg family protein [Bryobacterales bacterium]|nr:Gldg family protein [Bryobacterales bacterium]
MNDRWRLPKAILKRELTSYFSSPTGYVFITLFVFLSAVAAFWQEAFFANNLANLDPLNAFMPYLLVFLIPAITMSLWAEEKRNGTDELLLTLPASDRDIVIGKYLAALTIYEIALLFSLSHVLVLLWLGSPDLGLMFSTYLGYWLMGAALLTLGMLASLLVSNLTVAFILGAAFCAVPVFIDHAGVILTGGARRLIEGLSFRTQFEDFAAGVVSLSSLLYFVTFTLAMLYLNVALLGRRHWQTGKGAAPLGRHYLARALALLVIVASLTVLTGRLGGRADVTAERLHSLSDETVALIGQLDPERPVFIQAFLSPNVPRRYLQSRNNIVNVLREFNALGGGAIQTRVIETEKYTPEAREAQERYDIQPRPIPIFEQTPGSPDEIYFGLAFTRGAEEFVIPFFDPGLPAEYEIMRSVRVVSNAEKKKVGVLISKVNMFGGFDFQTRRRSADWSIVAELRKQYDVQRVPADSDYPADLDVLLAVLPHTITDEELERLANHVGEGHPALIMLDPMPAFNIELSPQIPPRNPFQQGGPPPTPPTSVQPLLDVLGLQWPKDQIAWDKYNPHPQIGALPEEIIFIGAGNKAAANPFNPEEPITAGLQEVVLLHSGVLKPAETDKTEFVPLLQTGSDSGQVMWMRLVQRTLFGIQLNPNVPHRPDEEFHVLAARVEGKEGDKPVRAIVVADLDMMGEQFFELRRRGVENLNFDNVTFLMNAVDSLAGDDSFIELRKRRPRHRTLEAVEARTRVYEEQRLEDTTEAEDVAEKRLEEAQERLDQAVEALQARTDLDAQTKRIMIANQQKVENRRLSVARKNIEDEKQRQMERARSEMESSIRAIQSTIKLLAVIIPPIPAFALFLLVSVRRLRREKIGVSPDRLVEQKKG